MARVKVGKPPSGLKDDQLQDWYADAFEDAYEKQLFDHREARRKAEAQVEERDAEIAELKKSVAEDGDVLLKGKDAERWSQIKDLDIDELQAKAAEGERTVRRNFLRDAAEAAGYNPRTFIELAELKDVEVVTEERQGRQQYAVKTEVDGKEQTVPLTEHFESSFADWLPALTNADRQGGARQSGTPSTGRLQNEGTRQRPTDAQRRVLEKAEQRRKGSQNVLLQSLNPNQNDGGSN